MAEEVRTKGPIDLKTYLSKNMQAIQAVAASIITPDRMVKLVLAAASREPKLAECSPISILRSMMQSAELGLEVCSGKNEAYLVPRWNSKTKTLEATFLPGYQGLIKLARESGAVRNVEARIVHSKDFFEVEQGTAPIIRHRPSFEKDRGEIVAVYAVAFLPDGGSQFEVMARYEVDEIRDRSKDKADFSPWKSDYSEMARKTVVRRLAKYLPKTFAFAKALEVQAKAEVGEYDLDGEVLRPGDAPIIETGSTKIEGFWAWSEEDKTTFLNMMDDLKEACIKANLTETETEEKIGFYMEQKRAGEDSPDRVMNRVYTATAELVNRAKKQEKA